MGTVYLDFAFIAPPEALALVLVIFIGMVAYWLVKIVTSIWTGS